MLSPSDWERLDTKFEVLHKRINDHAGEDINAQTQIRQALADIR